MYYNILNFEFNYIVHFQSIKLYCNYFNLHFVIFLKLASITLDFTFDSYLTNYRLKGKWYNHAFYFSIYLILLIILYNNNQNIHIHMGIFENNIIVLLLKLTSITLHFITS